MKYRTYAILSLFVLGLGLMLAPLPAAGAGGGETYSEPADSDLERAKVAIKDRNWDKAIELLDRAVARDPGNAEIHNQRGFTERNRGNLDGAFKHYETALTLDPKHRGAHEYIGEAYLMAGNPGKAEEHLAKLHKLCLFGCEEYTDLKEAIAKYKQEHQVKK